MHIFLSGIGAVGVFTLRLIEQTENQGDFMAKFWKFLPSFAFSTSMLYSSSREMLNSTRNYTEGERLQAMYKMEELPERNNITLESFALANMGGDALALSI